MTYDWERGTLCQVYISMHSFHRNSAHTVISQLDPCHAAKGLKICQNRCFRHIYVMGLVCVSKCVRMHPPNCVFVNCRCLERIIGQAVSMKSQRDYKYHILQCLSFTERTNLYKIKVCDYEQWQTIV